MTDTPVAAYTSRGRLVLRRFLRRRLALFGGVVVATLFVLAYLSPYVTPW